MKYRDFQGKQISQLGFGCMRLPVIDGVQANIDMKATEELFNCAWQNGVNYFDSAYVYHDQKSESAVGEIVKKNNMRDKLNLATKLPTFGPFAEGNFMNQLDEQLRRLQTDHIDFYLIHGIGRDRWDYLKEHGILDFLKVLETSGKVVNIGFSFHDSLDAYKYVIDEYDWNFSQIQFNFMDTEYQAGIEGLEYAASKGVPVVIMEPLRGGRLITLDDENVAKLKAKHNLTGVSIAQIALNFVFDRPEVLTVLSGMNTLSQVIENTAIASGVTAGQQNADEKAFLSDLKDYLGSKDTIPCTACRYCVPECPQDIIIPRILEEYNNAILFNNTEFARNSLLRFPTNIDNCVECETCVNVCPQNLQIPELLKKTKAYLNI